MADTQVIAVFRDEVRAHAAVRDLEGLGIPIGDIRVDERADAAAPARVGAGLTIGIAVGAIVGALVCAPASFIDVGGVAFGVRLAIAAIAGAIAGGTIGFVIGGGFSAAGEPDQPPAGTAVTIAVAAGRSDADVRRVLERHHPEHVATDSADHRLAGGVAQDVAHDVGHKLREAADQ